jgi:NADPH:quinone reductase-like Zn-dependent oxidoreductase
MKAIRLNSFGGPEVLELDEIARPPRPADAVLIKVAAASINPVDYKIRKGGYPKVTQADLPITPGRDLSGVVDEISPGSPHRRGDAVFAMLDWNVGGYAQYAAVPAAFCIPKPENLDLVESAAVPLAGITAWQGLFEYGGLTAGQRVLIHAGAGGVGHFAIQFAKARGAEVAATASTANLDFVRALGADIAIDHQQRAFEDEVRDVDVVFDLLGGATRERSWQTLKRGGILVSTVGQPDESTAVTYGVRAKGYMARPDGDHLTQIGRLIAAGRVRPTIAKTFPLAQAGEAQRFLEKDHPRGKVVLQIPH